MKNKIIYGLIFAALVFSTMGCKKYLDINTDPNSALSAPESLLLPPAIVDISTVVAGGCFSIQNSSGIAEINSYWMQQLSLNQPLPIVENYKLTTGDADNLWNDVYINIMQNLKILGTEAEANKNHSYGVISKVLTAYTLGVTTDMWGDVPFSQAFNGNFHPTYDKQEDVYKSIQSMLDSAIAENQLDPGNSVPGSDDFLYQGDMSKWEKFAYALKARDYMHLTKAPGYDAATQANLALAAVANAFTGTSDEATANIYADAAGHESPWYLNTAIGQGGVVLSATFINFELANSDPRLPIIANMGSLNTYLGRVNSSTVVPDVSIFSTVGDYYAGIASPVAIVPY